MNIYSPNPGTHIPALVKAVMDSDGPILELGMGLFSTPVLHALAEDQGRELYSLENKGKILRHFKRFENENHHLVFVPDWDEIDIEREWGVALVDHEPDERRQIELTRLSRWADYVVAHDSDGKTYSAFKYRLDYNKTRPNTVILSNKYEL